MGGLEIAVLALGVVGLAAFTSVAMHFADRRRARAAVAEAPRIADLEAWLQRPGSPLKVKVMAESGPGTYGTRIVIEGVCERLTLRKEEAAPPGGGGPLANHEPSALPATRELETGDDVFDRTFFVLGPPALVHAILDAETRRHLCRLIAREDCVDVEVARGELHFLVSVNYPQQAALVKQRGREGLALAHRLMTPADVASRLAHNARHDPDPAVRRANLTSLVREQPDTAVARVALRLAASDADPEVRLQAAVGLGDEGQEALHALAVDESVNDSCAARALDALGGRLDPERASAILHGALREAPGHTWTLVSVPAEIASPLRARSCVEALGRTRQASAVLVLRRVLKSQGGDLVVAAADALAALELPEAEAALIDGLHAVSQAGRVAAARGLGRAGTSAAVAPLREAASSDAGDVRRAAGRSIALIQSRLVGAPGEVSLAVGESGQVSMADDTSGRVSVPDPRG